MKKNINFNCFWKLDFFYFQQSKTDKGRESDKDENKNHFCSV
jgi:hypothetical protein